MNTLSMKWLLRREFWEHKGSMFWAPAIVGALLVLLVGGTIAYGVAGGHMPTHVTINGHTVAEGGVSIGATVETRSIIAKVAASMYMVGAMPLFLILAAVVFFYCLGALYDERRDRSILFWKSLPVSDSMTVLSKAATALLVAPLITIALATVSSLALLMVGALTLGAQGVNLFAPLFTSADLYLTPLRLVALLPVYIVWALPTVGWLLLVSSWARTKPFLWAVGVPLVALILLKWISSALLYLSGTPLGIMPLAQDLAARLLTGVIPGIWFSYKHVPPELLQNGISIDGGGVLSASYSTLVGLDAWIGAALGVAMLVGAIRLRRWRDEG
jgi:ABC-2 type transport system permease protein